MPLVEHSPLPGFRALRQQGQTILTPEQAALSDRPPLHVGLLNMMPDAAFEATERQFLRLAARSSASLLYVHPFTVEGLPRGPATRAYIAAHYGTLRSVLSGTLDALIITGTNVANPDLQSEPFYGPLTEVIRWASTNVRSVLCSCLATHAVLRSLHQIVRTPLPAKRWGVYSHDVLVPDHPLTRGLPQRIDVPHSRYNDISRDQFQQAGLTILVGSAEAGVHAAVGADALRRVYWQGHPEYDVNSLLKEYKREVLRHFKGERALPAFPEHYIPDGAASFLADYVAQARRARDAGLVLPEFPEREVVPLLVNTWEAAGQVFMDNWLGVVQELTLDRDDRIERPH